MGVAPWERHGPEGLDASVLRRRELARAQAATTVVRAASPGWSQERRSNTSNSAGSSARINSSLGSRSGSIYCAAMSADPPRIFVPGDGALPPALAGRSAEQAVLARCLNDLARGAAPSHNVVLVGLRGDGKTALLNWFKTTCGERASGVDVLRLTPGEVADAQGLIDTVVPRRGIARLLPRKVGIGARGGCVLLVASGGWSAGHRPPRPGRGACRVGGTAAGERCVHRGGRFGNRRCRACRNRCRGRRRPIRHAGELEPSRLRLVSTGARCADGLERRDTVAHAVRSRPGGRWPRRRRVSPCPRC